MTHFLIVIFLTTADTSSMTVRGFNNAAECQQQASAINRSNQGSRITLAAYCANRGELPFNDFQQTPRP